jgi:hypothetical protein
MFHKFYLLLLYNKNQSLQDCHMGLESIIKSLNNMATNISDSVSVILIFNMFILVNI